MNKKFGSINYIIDTHHLGLYVKEARLRHGYRLTEVAHEVCSVSVLSRIESGICDPTPVLFEKLAKKLKMRFPESDRQDPIEIFKTMIYCHNTQSMEDLLQDDCLYDYELPLLSFLMAVKKCDLKKAEKYKSIVDNWSNHLNLKEKQIYTLFNGIYYFLKYQWIEGARFLELSLKAANQRGIEEPLLYIEIAKYYFKTERNHLGFVFIKRAHDLFQKLLASKYTIECVVIWCDEYIKLGELDVASEKLEQLHHLQRLANDEMLANDILSFSGRISQLRGQGDIAEQIFFKLANKNIKNLSDSCLISIIEFYYSQGHLNQILDFINGLESNIKKMSYKIQTLLEYYYYKATNEAHYDYDFEIFLLDDAIPQARDDLDLANITMYVGDLVKLYEIKKSNKGIAMTYAALESFRNKLSNMQTIQK